MSFSSGRDFSSSSYESAIINSRYCREVYSKHENIDRQLEFKDIIWRPGLAPVCMKCGSHKFKKKEPAVQWKTHNGPLIVCIDCYGEEIARRGHI